MRGFAKAGAWFVAGVLAMVAVAASAQAPVEVPFFYPVAVGGPITKIIDGFAANFEKENPGIKLRPIYSGSYQESIAKALTAVKSGDPPVTSILPSSCGRSIREATRSRSRRR
jgi:sn-glycerol 3-phosphate transport system substrate-binding protein